jgi:hypothetical protein
MTRAPFARGSIRIRIRIRTRFRFGLRLRFGFRFRFGVRFRFGLGSVPLALRSGTGSGTGLTRSHLRVSQTHS